MDDNLQTMRTLLMCAAHCQGGHSEAGAAVADLFGIPFPLTMENLTKVAERHGFDRDDLWPWWKRMRENPDRLAIAKARGEEA